jgi:hypothetical protein
VVTPLPALQNRLIEKLVVISSNIGVEGKDNLAFMKNWQILCGVCATTVSNATLKN